MPLYIANYEADALARELSERTGETLTDAVLVALRERLSRLRESGVESRLKRALAIADLAAAAVAAHGLPTGDDLYDDYGLPT